MEKTKNLSVVCSNCGGQIDVNPLEETVECPFCGTNYAVSNLLNESDEVKIEKIKSNAQQKIEVEKLKQENDKNKTQEEKEEIVKFKKSKFSKVLLVFFAISVLFFFVGKGFFVKLLTGIQAISFIGSWLMGAKVIKEPMKGLRVILAIVAFVLIIPILGTGGGSSTTKSEKIIWKDIVMSEIIPEPKTNKGKISSNSAEHLSLYIHKASKEDYIDYIEACKQKGFTIDSEKDTTSYDAYNEEGYKLRIYYSEYSKEYNISVDAPMSMKENAWVDTPLSKLVPKPDSKIGKVQTESERYFTYYAGKTSKEDFETYANAVLNAGFSKDYHRGEDYFYGTNPDGYKVDIRYEGNQTMKISITAPEEDDEEEEEEKYEEKEDTSSKTEETKPTETKKPSDNKTSNNTEIRDDFKKAMDSYEDFMDEYIAFMKKYEKSNGTDMSLLADYSKYMSKYAQMCSDFAKWEDEDMNTAETAYYLEVQTRVNKKLLEVAQ